MTFNKPIVPATATPSSITAQTVVLTINGQTATIGRSATLSADGKTLTVDPNQALAFNTTYKLALNGTVGATAALRTAAGERLVNTAITFTVRPQLAAPTVVSATPANNDVGVASTANLR